MSDVTGDYRVPFDNVYRTSGGFICRQTANNDPEQMGLTWKLGGDFRSEVVIPLSKFSHDSLDALGEWLRGYEYVERFIQLCENQRYESPSVIDLNLLLHVLLGLARIQTTLAKEFGWTGPIFAKLEISGVWRTIPFFDTRYVLNEYEKHGIPLALRDKVILRSGSDQGSFIELSGLQDEDVEKHRIFMATHLFVIIAVALGISPAAEQEDDGLDFSSSIGDFLNAGLRALEVQKNRTQRS
jgi:hypothetical protein